MIEPREDVRPAKFSPAAELFMISRARQGWLLRSIMNNFQIILRRLVICDVPRRGKGGKGNPRGQNAVVHEPDRMLTSDYILPDETGLITTIEVASASDVPLGGKGGKGNPRG